MIYLKGNSFCELYAKVMDAVYNHPEYECSPRGMKIKEHTNAVLELTNPYDNLFKCDDKSLTLPSAYTKKEVLLYLSGTNSAELFTKATGFWGKIANPDGTINSAYGNLIFNPSLADGRSQFDWAFDSLKADKDSRQAFIRFNNTSHQHAGVKDLPCTFIGIFHIRENRLNFTIEMRSNDIVKGLIHDEPSFTLIQYLMYLRLKETKYPDLELGKYEHIANSLHVYESDFDLCKRRLANKLIPNSFPMPKNWRCIKSFDIENIVKTKIVNCLKGEVVNLSNVTFSENADFYNWLLS